MEMSLPKNKRIMVPFKFESSYVGCFASSRLKLIFVENESNFPQEFGRSEEKCIF